MIFLCLLSTSTNDLVIWWRNSQNHPPTIRGSSLSSLNYEIDCFHPPTFATMSFSSLVCRVAPRWHPRHRSQSARVSWHICLTLLPPPFFWIQAEDNSRHSFPPPPWRLLLRTRVWGRSGRHSGWSALHCLANLWSEDLVYWRRVVEVSSSCTHRIWFWFRFWMKFDHVVNL